MLGSEVLTFLESRARRLSDASRNAHQEAGCGPQWRDGISKKPTREVRSQGRRDPQVDRTPERRIVEEKSRRLRFRRQCDETKGDDGEAQVGVFDHVWMLACRGTS